MREKKRKQAVSNGQSKPAIKTSAHSLSAARSTSLSALPVASTRPLALMYWNLRHISNSTTPTTIATAPPAHTNATASLAGESCSRTSADRSAPAGDAVAAEATANSHTVMARVQAWANTAVCLTVVSMRELHESDARWKSQ